MRYAVIDETGLVENVIELDPEQLAPQYGTEGEGDDAVEVLIRPAFSLPGKSLVAHDEAAPGWTFDGASFVAPPAPEPIPVVAPRVRLPKLTLIDRLDKMHLLDKAIVVLGDGKQRIRWDASSSVDPSNPDVRMLLTVIAGAEHVDELLAPETDEERAL
jgi:hypothetical protein